MLFPSISFITLHVFFASPLNFDLFLIISNGLLKVSYDASLGGRGGERGVLFI